ncbi:hypothetical protein [Chryseobacterium arthrosphaerae]|uniref:hypothetical protein n=1 Tax=Chryseobacterium arthrosphaerae TaxID=651561 RepID=UPI00241E3662|nr:hypothetical protein [Chryseobacterium arthrosphaerae]
MRTAIKLIKRERKKQINSALLNTHYEKDELFYAGCCYHSAVKQREAGCHPGTPPTDWPFPKSYWRPTPNKRIKEIIKAGALLQTHFELTGSELARVMVYVCAREIEELLNENKNEKTRVLS